MRLLEVYCGLLWIHSMLQFPRSSGRALKRSPVLPARKVCVWSQKPKLHSAGSESTREPSRRSAKQKDVAPTSARHRRAAHQNQSLLTSRSREGGGLKSSLSLLSVNLGSGLKEPPQDEKGRHHKTNSTCEKALQPDPRLPRTSKKIPFVRLRRTCAWTIRPIRLSTCQRQLAMRCRSKKL